MNALHNGRLRLTPPASSSAAHGLCCREAEETLAVLGFAKETRTVLLGQHLRLQEAGDELKAKRLLADVAMIESRMRALEIEIWRLRPVRGCGEGRPSPTCTEPLTAAADR